MHLPEWLSPFKRAEALRKRTMQEAFYEAQKDVMDRVAAGTAEQSWARIWLENGKKLEKRKLDQHEAAHAVGTNAFVAVVTIGSPLHSFVAAMCHYNSWMGRLHHELDSICGDRLPSMSDLPHLAVLRAVVKETLRWRQPTPLGVPHITTEDDVYNGYFIPKGAMPLTEFPTLRGDCGFGYGTRSCTGIDLVQTELYPLIGALAWSFDISRKDGREGCENPVPWYETNPFVITMVKPFPCEIKPRSEEKRRFILAGCEDDGLLVKDGKAACERWDVHKEDGKAFTWEGLTAPLTGCEAPRTYSAGV